MATNASAPHGAMSPATNKQLPDCIIASSNRFLDLLPFCNSLYSADPQKWGRILPWEFPQAGSKEVEEAFLRRYFNDVDIHMQGGAHGSGEGFRFLKQAWYSIALWNYEQRVPSIANWWLDSKENSSVLEDPAMREHLCKAEVTPETFFESRDIQLYGKSLLSCVVGYIQGKVKAQQLEAMEQPKSTNATRSASDPVVGTGSGLNTSLVVSSSPVTSLGDQDAGSTDGRLPRVAPASAPADRLLTPMATQGEVTAGKHRAFVSDSERPPWNTEFAIPQVQRGKRGGRFGSGGNGYRGAGFDRRSQEHQHRSNSYMNPTNNGFEMHPSPAANPVPGLMYQQNQAASAYPEFTVSTQGAPPVPTYNTPGARNPRQYPRSRNLPHNELNPQAAMIPGVFGVIPNMNYPTHQRETERVMSAGPTYSAFNDISSGSGDARRSSIGSRGGGPRGYGHNRGGKRGGRARDSGSQTAYLPEEGYGARRPPNDSYARPNFNSGKRRGSAYQANTWRSGSEHPQVENDPPHRVLSMPDKYQYPTFQNLSSVAGPHQPPPFSFPHAQDLGHQGQPEHCPAPVRLPNQSRSFPDMEVDEKYIGADAAHVTELIAFNIPVQATEEDVAKDFRIACDVDVVKVHFDSGAQYGPADHVKPAFVRFSSHIDARHVLDLREVQLYGKPMEVRVPRRMLSEQGMPYDVRNHGYGINPNFESEPHQWSHDYQRALAPPPHLEYALPVVNSPAYPPEVSQQDIASVPAFVPTFASRGENPLSTVLASNATPTTSVTNTPKKKSKKKGKNRLLTPRDQTTEDEPGLQARLTRESSLQETPVKAQGKQQRLQDHATSSGLPSSEGVASGSTPSSKHSEKSRDAEGIAAQRRRVSVTASGSQATTDIETVSDSPQKPQTSPATTSKVYSQRRPSFTSSSHADLILHSQPLQYPTVDKKLQSLTRSSQESEEESSIADMTPDSDHVDESFHTASASPPMEKHAQSQPTSKEHGKPAATEQPNFSTTEAKKSRIFSQDGQSAVDTEDHFESARGGNIAKESDSPISPATLNKIERASSVRTSNAPLPVSVPNATPPKTQPAGMSARSKSPQSTSQRSVSDQSDARKKTFRVEISSKHGNAKELRHAATQRVISEDRGYGRTESSMNKSERKSQENNAPEPAAQRVVSGGSVPETPMTAYYTAPTTPTPVLSTTPEKAADKLSVQLKTTFSPTTTPEKAADKSSSQSKTTSSPTTASEKAADKTSVQAGTASSSTADSEKTEGKSSAHSQTASVPTTAPKKPTEKASAQSKTPVKKGPSQTESFSQFSRDQQKQQKQKKQAKGKNTLRGKPLESGDVPSLASGVTGQSAISNTTSAPPSAVKSSGKKPALSIESRPQLGAGQSHTRVPKKDSKSNETSLEDSTTQAISGQESPTKGGLRKFFGLFGRAKSPSVSGKDTSLDDVPQQEELTGMKAPAAIPETGFSIDYLLQGGVQDRFTEQVLGDETAQPFTSLDHASDFDGIGRTLAAGLGMSASDNLDLKETPKKKKKKKKSKSSSAQQSEASKESYSGPDRSKEEEEAVSGSASDIRKDAVDGSFEVESDNKSDQSSTTMGRPTPPVSPTGLTPSKRKRIEQSKTGEHIISSPAPRNKHVKKKSYSRTASSAASAAAQESSRSSQSVTAPDSDTEADQQRRVIQVFTVSPRASFGGSGGDDYDDSHGAGLFMPDVVNDDGNTQQVNFLTVPLEHFPNFLRFLDVYNYGRFHDDAGSDDVAVAAEATEEDDDDRATEATISDLGTPDMEE